MSHLSGVPGTIPAFVPGRVTPVVVILTTPYDWVHAPRGVKERTCDLTQVLSQTPTDTERALSTTFMRGAAAVLPFGTPVVAFPGQVYTAVGSMVVAMFSRMGNPDWNGILCVHGQASPDCLACRTARELIVADRIFNSEGERDGVAIFGDDSPSVVLCRRDLVRARTVLKRLIPVVYDDFGHAVGECQRFIQSCQENV